MGKSSVVEFQGRERCSDPLTEMLRVGAQRLIQQAVEAELQELLTQHAERRTADGKAGIVRNGHLPRREIQTGVGPVPVKIPKVRAKTGEPVTFRSALVPPYVRKTKTLEAALPWLYLKGVSSGEMGEALNVLLGPQAQGVSAPAAAALRQRMTCSTYNPFLRQYSASSSSFSAAVSMTTASLFSPLQLSGLDGSAGTAFPS